MAKSKANKQAKDAPETQGAAETVENAPIDEVAEAKTKDVAAPSGDRAENDPSRRRMWFVRMPRPANLPDTKALEIEVETYQAQVRLMSESLTVLKVERDAIRDNVRTAREALKRCREAFDTKNAEVKPLRDALATGSEANRNLKEGFADLEARSEAELNEKIQAANHRIEHESIPLNEEKKLIAYIKKLEAQRPKVIEYQTSRGTVAEVRADIDRVRAELKEHDAELSVLRSERDTQQAIVNKFRDQEAESDAKVEAAMAERRRLRELQDAAYAQLSEARRTTRAKNDVHFGNRRVSRAVRELVAKGKLDEARDLCAKQMEEAHAKIAEDAEFRKGYFKLWDEQRKARLADDEDSAVLATGSGKTAAAAAAPKVPVVEPAVKAQAVIAAALEAAAAAAVEEPAPVVQQIQDADTNGHDAAAPVEVVGAEPSSAAVKHHQKKHKHPVQYVAEPVVEPEDNFTLPEVVLQRPEESSGRLDKAAERERNRKLQQEAEARKAKREAEKQKRKEKAAHQAELEKEAAAKAAAMAAARDISTGSLAGAATAEGAAENGTAAVAVEKTDDSAAAAVVESAPAGVVMKGAPPLLKVAAGAARVAKRPAGPKKTFARQVKALLLHGDNALLTAVVCVLLAFVLLAFVKRS